MLHSDKVAHQQLAGRRFERLSDIVLAPATEDAALFLTVGTCCRFAIQLLAWPVFLGLISPGLGVRSLCWRDILPVLLVEVMLTSWRSSAAQGVMAMMQSSVLPLTIFYIAANVAGMQILTDSGFLCCATPKRTSRPNSEVLAFLPCKAR